MSFYDPLNFIDSSDAKYFSRGVEFLIINYLLIGVLEYNIDLQWHSQVLTPEGAACILKIISI